MSPKTHNRPHPWPFLYSVLPGQGLVTNVHAPSQALTQRKQGAQRPTVRRLAATSSR